MFLGSAPEGTYIADGEAFAGLLLQQGERTVHRLSLEN